MSSSFNTVLITGCNRGIGLAFTKHCVDNGWKVFAAVRDPQIATELRELKVEKILEIDTSDEDSILASAMGYCHGLSGPHRRGCCTARLRDHVSRLNRKSNQILASAKQLEGQPIDVLINNACIGGRDGI